MTTFVVNERVYEVRFVLQDDPRSATVTVTLNGGFEWSLTVRGWRGVAMGASGDIAYIWSAREFVVLPDSLETDLRVIEVDEDLLFAFRVDDGWLFVCETSIRRLIGGTETARVELGEVVDHVRWDQGVLHVRDATGEELRVRVEGERLDSWLV